MKGIRVIILAAATVAASTLAACSGGGGSTGGGNPLPTSTPTVTYSVKVKFTGGASLKSPQARLLSVRIQAHAMNSTGANQLPVELSLPPVTGSQYTGEGTSGVASVVVSPQPTSTPIVAISTSGVAVTTTPLPYASPGPTDPPRFTVAEGNINAPATGQLTATVTAPTQMTVNVPIYAIQNGALACGAAQIPGQDSQYHSADNVAGLAFASGQATVVTIKTQADLYFACPNASAVGFNDATLTDATIFAPYGMVQESSLVAPFATLTAAQWSNAQTSITATALQSALTNPTTPNDEWLIQTASGKVVKIAFYSLLINASGTPQQSTGIYFAWAQAGFSQDGFQ